MTKVIGDVENVLGVKVDGFAQFWAPTTYVHTGVAVVPDADQVPIKAGKFTTEVTPGRCRIRVVVGSADALFDVNVPDQAEIAFSTLLEGTVEYEPAVITEVARLVDEARRITAVLGSAEQIKTWTEESDADAKAAALSASAAKSSETNASSSKTAAGNSATAAAASAGAAKTSETNAATSKNAASASASAAASSATAADGSKSAAASSASAAKNSETAAGNSATTATDARNSAQAYAGTAQTQAQAAQASADTATSKAGEASSSASAAKTSETKAKASETAAASSASTASQASMVAQDAAVVATAAAQSVTTYSGKGSPEGKVAAGVGALYVDSVATCGAVTWRKVSGTGNTGWRVENGDTGWRDITSLLSPAPTSGALKVRRWNDTLWIQASWLLAPRGTYSLTLPYEWGPLVNSGGNFNNSGGAITADCRFVFTGGLTIKKNDDGSIDSVDSFVPKDAFWPTTLPGTPA